MRTWVEIDRRSLLFNLRKFQKLAGSTALMAVVKSNAYGHGLALTAKMLADHQSALSHFPKLWFGVDAIDEAATLRRAGIKHPILVLGHTPPALLAEAARHNFAVTVSNFEALRNLARARKQPRFHIKIDTGMHRQGFQLGELSRLIKEIKRQRLSPEGVYSHLASAENRRFSRRQIAAFLRAVEALRSAGVAPKFLHMAATGGIKQRYLPSFGIARLGLGLYGYLPDGRAGFVRPALSWKTVVSEVKRVRRGERIGYDLTERFRRDATVAILPIGYWHGFDRGLSKVGEVLIRGRRRRVLGKVSMDMTAVDVTNPKHGNVKLHKPKAEVRPGDEVVLIGRQGREFIGADEVAKKIGTISYEILTRINPLIPRIAARP